MPTQTLSRANSNRHQVLGRLLAAGLPPLPTWAKAGSPRFLSAVTQPDGPYVLSTTANDPSAVFEWPRPARGHAAAAHPSRPKIVAFARRPGTFAVVIDCVTGRQTAQLSTPSNRHFYGHGTFSKDGNLLFINENDFNLGRGRIGVWDADHGYRRVDEWDSGRIGPHDTNRLPGSDRLVVANGGIDTHPDTGRTKLNIANMHPDLAYLDQGQVIKTASLPAKMHKTHPVIWPCHPKTLIAPHAQGQDQNITPITLPHDAMRALNGYIGSIAISTDGRVIAATSPRGGLVQCCDVNTLALRNVVQLRDVCGVSAHGTEFIATTGEDALDNAQNWRLTQSYRTTHLRWDNHLIAL